MKLATAVLATIALVAVGLSGAAWAASSITTTGITGPARRMSSMVMGAHPLPY